MLIGSRGSRYNIATKAEAWRCSRRPECGEWQEREAPLSLWTMRQEGRTEPEVGVTFKGLSLGTYISPAKSHLLNVPKYRQYQRIKRPEHGPLWDCSDSSHNRDTGVGGQTTLHSGAYSTHIMNEEGGAGSKDRIQMLLVESLSMQTLLAYRRLRPLSSIL